MLTADLVRVSQKDGVLHPRYVAITSLQKKRSMRLIEAFEEHVGSSRRVLDDALGELLGERTDFKLHKGLVTLLLDRCTFEVSICFRDATENAPPESHAFGQVKGHPRDLVRVSIDPNLAA